MDIKDIPLEHRQWLAQCCTRNMYTDPKVISDTHYAVVAPFMFTHAIIVGRIGDNDSYEDRWCYKTYEDARDGLAQWSGEGWERFKFDPETEPQGWHRHPLTGRRRVEGEPEYINE